MQTTTLRSLTSFHSFIYVSVMISLRHVDSQVFYIKEELPEGSFIANIKVDGNISDKTGAPLSFRKRIPLQFRFLDNDVRTSSKFRITKTEGILLTNERLDRESICPYIPRCLIPISIVVYSRNFFQIVRVSIEVEDTNDNPPTFPVSEFQLNILESVSIPSAFQIDSAVDRDLGRNSRLTYTIRPNISNFELIENKQYPELLTLMVVSSLDRETKDSYILVVIAADDGTPKLTGSTTVIVRVTDFNDQAPVFSKSSYTTTVNENVALNTPLISLAASDSDIGPNAEISYAFSYNVLQSIRNVILLNSSSGLLSTRNHLDYELDRYLEFNVECRDHGNPTLSSEASVEIKILDVNDNKPQLNFNFLTDSEPEIKEGEHIDKFLAHLSVVDKDSGDNANVTCFLKNNQPIFQIRTHSENEYQIILNGSLDREVVSMYKVQVCCTDKGSPPLVSCGQFSVRVLDVNDNSPKFASRAYSFNVVEGHNGTIGYLNLTDADSGRNSELTIHMMLDNNENLNLTSFFSVTSNGTFIAKQPIDRERLLSKLTIRVRAVDNGLISLSDAAIVYLHIDDVNDEFPIFERKYYWYKVPENMELNQNTSKLSQIMATDLDSNLGGIVKYFIVNATKRIDDNFALNPTSGNLYMKHSFDREELDMYTFTVVAKDLGQPTLKSFANVTVQVLDKNDNTPMIEFPKQSNNTIYITKPCKAGDIVTKVIAFDKDIGLNSRMEYNLVNNGSQLFSLDNSTGFITCTNTLEINYAETFALSIVVSDTGSPSLRSNETLFIRVNLNLFTGHLPRFVTVLIIVATSLFLIFILLFFVAYLHRKSKMKKNEKTNVSSWLAESNGSANASDNGNAKHVTMNHDYKEEKYDKFINLSPLNVECNGVKNMYDERVSQPSLGLVMSEQKKPSDTLEMQHFEKFSPTLRSAQNLSPLIPYLYERDNFFDVSSDTSVTSDSGRGGSDICTRETDFMSPSYQVHTLRSSLENRRKHQAFNNKPDLLLITRPEIADRSLNVDSPVNNNKKRILVSQRPNKVHSTLRTLPLKSKVPSQGSYGDSFYKSRTYLTSLEVNQLNTASKNYDTDVNSQSSLITDLLSLNSDPGYVSTNISDRNNIILNPARGSRKTVSFCDNEKTEMRTNLPSTQHFSNTSGTFKGNMPGIAGNYSTRGSLQSIPNNTLDVNKSTKRVVKFKEPASFFV